jgi:hypothetical protein
MGTKDTEEDVEYNMEYNLQLVKYSLFRFQQGGFRQLLGRNARQMLRGFPQFVGAAGGRRGVSARPLGGSLKGLDRRCQLLGACSFRCTFQRTDPHVILRQVIQQLVTDL